MGGWQHFWIQGEWPMSDNDILDLWVQDDCIFYNLKFTDTLI